MAFPDIKPASREYDPGDWPIKRYSSNSGAEVRMLYGSRRVNAKLRLGYENIPDANAQSFLDDFNAQAGTYATFTLPGNVFAGWTGSRSSIDAPPSTRWRYEEPPRVTSVFPGRSSVQISLVAVA
jgi:hypothetical protein